MFIKGCKTDPDCNNCQERRRCAKPDVLDVLAGVKKLSDGSVYGIGTGVKEGRVVKNSRRSCFDMLL
jgi:hypothetical protein